MKKYCNIGSGIIINLVSIVAFYLAFNSVKTAILYTIPIILVSLIVIIICLYRDKNKLETIYKKQIEKFQELEKSQEALANQYKLKKKKLKILEQYWENLNIVFLITTQGSEKERFYKAYDLYQRFTVNIINEIEEE